MRPAGRISVILTMSVAAIVAAGVLRGSQPAEPARIDGFTLSDAHGRSWSLAELHEAPVVVVVFVGNDCPLARLYAPRLARPTRTRPSKSAGATRPGRK